MTKNILSFLTIFLMISLSTCDNSNYPDFSFSKAVNDAVRKIYTEKNLRFDFLIYGNSEEIKTFAGIIISHIFKSNLVIYPVEMIQKEKGNRKKIKLNRSAICFVDSAKSASELRNINLRLKRVISIQAYKKVFGNCK